MKIKFYLINLFLFSTLFLYGTSSDASFYADKIIVKKSQKELILLKDGRVYKEYDIQLGKNPRGDKTYEGDNRTPEGSYHIAYKNPNSDYNLALKISYPDEYDVAQAKAMGKNPGGDIMIHGQDNNATFFEKFFNTLLNRDWTAGCIAVDDDDMREIYALVPQGTPIEIRP